MKYGDKTRIAKHIGCSSSRISEYFNGTEYVSVSMIEKINKAIIVLKIQTIDDKKTIIKKRIARKDRYEIYNNLPIAGQRKIARKLGCTDSYVSSVLKGARTDHRGIIKEAEYMAAINIWKTRFCRFESEL